MLLKRIVPIITVTAIILCLAKNIQVRANDITNNYDILALQPGIDLTSIIDAYERLTTQQQFIAEYLVGAFNNIYLTARGFRYNIDYDETNLQAQFSALGSKVFDFLTTRIGWKSRVNEVFRQYLSSVIVYASAQSMSFANWFQGQVSGQDRKIFIPYSEDAFDAWTTFYNDPSGDGIATFGNLTTPWVSGTDYDFEFVGMTWYQANYETIYNNFILNYSPVIFTNTRPASNNSTLQIVLSSDVYPDSLFILRNSSSNQYYRYGVGLTTGQRISYKYLNLRLLNNNQIQLYQYSGSNGYLSANVTLNIVDTGQSNTVQELLDWAFEYTPFNNHGGWYTLIQHVYVVDDLTTLSNPEEIYNIDDLNIIAPAIDGYIIAPNDRMILPSFPGVPDDPLGFWDIIVDNSLDVNGDNVTDDDYHTSIVNNNVINNYYVSDDVKINVPVDWFANPYTDQMYEDSSNFIDFAKDCIDCLGDFDIYMYGAIVVGLAGGIVKKLLL